MGDPTLRDMLPDVWPPRGWTLVPNTPIERLGGVMVVEGFSVGSLQVGVSLERHPVGLWLHSSTSKRGRTTTVLPSLEDLARVKRLIHGDRLVVQVLPPRSEYVNLAEVLHLWERIDEPTLPIDTMR